jgi:rhodanese-related sulfurtransferase
MKFTKQYKGLLGLALVVLLMGWLTGSAAAQAAAPQKAPAPVTATEAKPAAPAPDQKAEVPKDRETTLGLYVTAKEAHALWQKDPDTIKILDCRTPEEYNFVGHAPMARNIPSKFMLYQWDEKKKENAYRENKGFVPLVKKACKSTDTILVMCRSGHRSRDSVNILAKAGFSKVYNVIDGFEGDKVKAPGTPQDGKRVKNGWRNSDLPWTYVLDTKLMYLPKKK